IRRIAESLLSLACCGPQRRLKSPSAPIAGGTTVDRRTFLKRSGAMLALAGSGALFPAVAQDGNQADGMMNDRTRQAVDGSLAWLSRQQHQNGSFGTGAYNGNVAVTALGGLA